MQLVLSSFAALSFTLGGRFMKHADGLCNQPAGAVFHLLFALGAGLQSHAMRGTEMAATYISFLVWRRRSPLPWASASSARR